MNTTRQVDVKALVSHILRGDGIDKCRICMGDTTEGQVYLGDTVMLDGERPVTLAELLETITGVEIETTPTLPSRLCIYCVSKLLDFIPFMQLCAESNRKWSRVVELLNLPQTVNKSVHVVLSNDCEKKELLACPKITNRTIKEALRVLKLRLIRKKLYKRRADHERRMKMVHDSRLKCPECDKRFHTAFRLNKHMRNIKKKMCSRCFMVLDIEEFKTHSQMHNVRVYTCDICFACFEKKRYFLTHKLKHSRGKHVCVECKLSFSKWSKLISHLSRHKRCICSTCGKKFSNKVCYLNHAKVCAESTDLDLAKFICDYCGKEYARKATLKIHIKTIHVEGAKYQCDKCGKTFTNRSHFVEHGNTHEKVADRYVCECGVNYSSRRGYERHMKRHLMEHTDKPQVLKTKSYIEYRCVVCEETFTKLKDFKYHTRTHWSYDSSFVDEPDMEIEVITIK